MAAGRPPRVALGGILLLAFGLRALVSWGAYASTFDTSTVGLMALHILEGERPLFFYGQHYMGSIEAYVAALMFKVFGVSVFTLSLSPILCSLAWIGAVYLLFAEIYDRRAGLVAALVTAVPGWETLWYSIGSYGGYPAALFFGTFALWLQVRIVTRALTPAAEWIHVLTLGLVAGLGLWTHYLCASFLLTGGLLQLGHLVRNRFPPRLLAKYAAAAVPFAAGFWPSLRVMWAGGGGQVASWNLSRAAIQHSLGVLWHRHAEQLMFWPVGSIPAVKAAAGIGLALAAALATWRLVELLREGRGPRVFIPCLFGAVFMAMYLPHPLAPTGATRYLIPFAAMMIGSAFALAATCRRRALRRAGEVLLVGWLLYNGGSAVALAFDLREDTVEDIRRGQEVVEEAQRLGATNVAMVGGTIFGHEGQTLSVFARGEIRFSSVLDERYQPAAQAADGDGHLLFAFETAKWKKMDATLALLGVEGRMVETPRVSLLQVTRVPEDDRRLVPCREMTIVQGAASNVLDRTVETVFEREYGPDCGFVADLGRERDVNGVWLVAPGTLQEGLPETYTIEMSRDGRDYAMVANVKQRFSVSFTAGAGVFFKGYYGMQETRFTPVRARYLRLRFLGGAKEEGRCSISEFYVFERGGGEADPCADLAGIADALMSNDVRFAACDRWLSGRLYGRLPTREGRPRVYPRYNPKCRSTRISRRVRPLAGEAVVVARALAEETDDLLREVCGGAVSRRRQDFSAYSLFLFTNRTVPPMLSDLTWNGQMLLKTREPDEL
jgi:hypothetical protein